ncbi:MAG: hypothetical protein AAFO91_01700, partial [Bacteroidota bacterium]
MNESFIQSQEAAIKIEEFPDAKQVQFLSKNGAKTGLYYTVNVLTLGINILIFHWLSLHVYLYDKEDDYERSTHVLVVTTEDNWLILEIQSKTVCILPLNRFDHVGISKKEQAQRDLPATRRFQTEGPRQRQRLMGFLENKARSQADNEDSIDFGQNGLQEILKSRSEEKNSLLGSSHYSVDLLNPQNEHLALGRGKVTRRVISLNNRTYFYHELKRKFIVLETVFERHILKAPNLVHQVYYRGNTETKETELFEFFGTNTLDIETKAFMSDLMISLFDPMNFGVFLLMVFCIISNKMVEAFDFGFYTAFIIIFLIVEKNSRIKKIKKLTRYRGQVEVRRPVYRPDKKEHDPLLKMKVKQYKFEEKDVRQLLPGDIVRLRGDTVVYFDGVIVQGSCLVDESLLTGESVPVTKKLLQPGADKLEPKNMIYCGSKILVAREQKVYALVMTTNWNTFKGRIISSLVSSKTPQSIMKEEVVTFIKWCVIFCVVFLVFLFGYEISRGRAHHKVFMTHIVDVLDTGIQPTVIFMFQAIYVIVGSRLADRDLHLLDSDKLFQAGRVDTICFDKTGTLTKSEMNLFGICLEAPKGPERPLIQPDSAADLRTNRQNPSASGIRLSQDIPISISQSDTNLGSGFTSNFSSIGSVKSKPKLRRTTLINQELKNLPNLYFRKEEIKLNSDKEKRRRDTPFMAMRALACCHDLHRINRKIVGDPIDKELFSFTGFSLKLDEGLATGAAGELITESDHSSSGNDYKNLKTVSKRQFKPVSNYHITSMKNFDPSMVINNIFQNLPKVAPYAQFKKEYHLPQNFAYHLVKIEPYSSAKKKMSVLVYGDGQFTLVTKGAPETVRKFCRKETLPKDFAHTVMKFGQHGMKVLTFAQKTLDFEGHL